MLPFIAAAAAIGVAVYALAGGFKQSAESKLADAKASEGLIKKDIKLNQAKQDGIKKNLDLVASYANLKPGTEEYNETLENLRKEYPELNLETNNQTGNLEKLQRATGTVNIDFTKLTTGTKNLITEFSTLAQKENQSATEKDRLKTISKDLRKIYPGLTIDTNNYAGSIHAIEKAAGLTNSALDGLVTQSKKLSAELLISYKKTLKVKSDMAIQEAQSSLTTFGSQ